MIQWIPNGLLGPLQNFTAVRNGDRNTGAWTTLLMVHT